MTEEKGAKEKKRYSDLANSFKNDSLSCSGRHLGAVHLRDRDSGKCNRHASTSGHVQVQTFKSTSVSPLVYRDDPGTDVCRMHETGRW